MKKNRNLLKMSKKKFSKKRTTILKMLYLCNIKKGQTITIKKHGKMNAKNTKLLQRGIEELEIRRNFKFGSYLNVSIMLDGTMWYNAQFNEYLDGGTIMEVVSKWFSETLSMVYEKESDFVIITSVEYGRCFE